MTPPPMARLRPAKGCPGWGAPLVWAAAACAALYLAGGGLGEKGGTVILDLHRLAAFPCGGSLAQSQRVTMSLCVDHSEAERDRAAVT